MTVRALIISIALFTMPTAAMAQIREEAFQASSGDAVLAGTLSLPADSPRAAVVLIQGNGPHTRDQVISGAPMFRALAEALAEHGVASVRIDNSGVGESTGERIQHFRQRTPQIVSTFDVLASHTFPRQPTPTQASWRWTLAGHRSDEQCARIWSNRLGIAAGSNVLFRGSARSWAVCRKRATDDRSGTA